MLSITMAGQDFKRKLEQDKWNSENIRFGFLNTNKLIESNKLLIFKDLVGIHIKGNVYF